MPFEGSSEQADYFQLMNAQGTVAIYDTAVAIGVLPLLCRESLTLTELCQQTATKERAMALLLEALIAINLVAVDSGRYQATMLPGMLLSSDYRELGRQYWMHLPTLLKTGEPMMEMQAPLDIERHYVRQAQSLAWMLLPSAHRFVPQFAHDYAGKPLSIVDIGCGAGLWSMMLASTNAESRVTLVDWPAVLEVAKQNAGRFGVSNRVTYQPGSYHEVSLEADAYDVAILANVTHLESEESNLRLFKRVYASLKPSGKLLIVDAFPQPGVGSATFALYQLGLALRTRQGMIHDQASLVRMVTDVGLEDPIFESIDAPPFMIGAIVAQKK